MGSKKTRVVLPPGVKGTSSQKTSTNVILPICIAVIVCLVAMFLPAVDFQSKTTEEVKKPQPTSSGLDIPSRQEQMYSKYVKKAHAAQGERKWQDAVEFFEQALHIAESGEVDATEAHFGAGLCLQQIREFEASVEHFRAGVQHSPGFARGHHLLAVALSNLRMQEAEYQELTEGLLNEILDSYNKLEELDTEVAEESEENEEEEGEEAAPKRTYPSLSDEDRNAAYFDFANTLLAEGRWLDALAKFDSIDATWKAEETQTRFARALAKTGEYALALTKVEECMDKSARCAAVAAEIYYYQGDDEKRLEALRLVAQQAGPQFSSFYSEDGDHVSMRQELQRIEKVGESVTLEGTEVARVAEDMDIFQLKAVASAEEIAQLTELFESHVSANAAAKSCYSGNDDAKSFDKLRELCSSSDDSVARWDEVTAHGAMQHCTMVDAERVVAERDGTGVAVFPESSDLVTAIAEKVAAVIGVDTSLLTATMLIRHSKDTPAETECAPATLEVNPLAFTVLLPLASEGRTEFPKFAVEVAHKAGDALVVGALQDEGLCDLDATAVSTPELFLKMTFHSKPDADHMKSAFEFGEVPIEEGEDAVAQSLFLCREGPFCVQWFAME